MGPLVPNYKNDQSTDSDEEKTVRHDRFKSERFQEEDKQYSKHRERERSYASTEKHSRRHRERSPLSRCYSSRSSNSSSSPHQIEVRRSDHDRRNKVIHSKHNTHERKHYKNEESKNFTNKEMGKNTLSSILKNYDERLKSNHKNKEKELHIGPALPPQLQEIKKDNKVVTNDLLNGDCLIGPILPQSPTTPGSSSNDLCNVSSKPLEEKTIDQSKVESCKITTANTASIHKIEEAVPPPQLKCNISTCDLKSTDVDNSEQVSTSLITNLCNKVPLKNTETVKKTYGPILPPVIESMSYGPALPPNFKKDHVLGPNLPEGIKSDQLETLIREESEDEDVVGPLPEGKMNMTQFQLDLRASQIKRKLHEDKCGSSDITKREEWMVELPPEKASNLGLGPRSFRIREAPDMSDRSSWTDTPADKLRKIEQSLTGESEPINSEEMKRIAFMKERENAMEKMAQLTQDQDRPKSLLELHQKKIKKKKKKEEKEGKKKERRPFDRNIDLQVNRFDDAQKKAIFKKAQLLDTRFSAGESKYL